MKLNEVLHDEKFNDAVKKAFAAIKTRKAGGRSGYVHKDKKKEYKNGVRKHKLDTWA